jgi:Thioredoxin
MATINKRYVIIGVIGILAVIAAAFLLSKLRFNPLKDIEFMENKPSSVIQVVYFYMHGCGHCQTFMPEWDKFAGAALAHKDSRYVLETSKHEQGESTNKLVDEYVNKRQIVSYFPHVRMIHSKNGQTIADEEYKGDRTVEALNAGLKSFVERQKF